MPNLNRLQAHEEAAASRDVRFRGYSTKKILKWQAELNTYLTTGEGDLAELKSSRWTACPGCGIWYQPTPARPDGTLGSYSRCFTCSTAERADGRVACALCTRWHSTSFPCCAVCAKEGREDQASLIRSTTLRKCHFECALCGTDENVMQVHRINPEMSPWPWVMEALCTPCFVICDSSKSYGQLDELALLDMMQAYDSYLRDYLTDDEKTELQAQFRETMGGDFIGKPCLDRVVLSQMILGANLGECDEIEGLMNALNGFGGAANGVTASHV